MKNIFNKILTIVLVVAIGFTVSFLTFDILDMLEVFGEEEVIPEVEVPFTYDGGDGFFGNKLVDQVINEYKLVNYDLKNVIDGEYLTVETFGMSRKDFIFYQESRARDYYVLITIEMPYFPNVYSNVKDGVKREKLIIELANTLLYKSDENIERTLSFATKRKYSTQVTFVRSQTEHEYGVYISCMEKNDRRDYDLIQGDKDTAEGLIAIDKYLDTL